jgi:hypothetical protein
MGQSSGEDRGHDSDDDDDADDDDFSQSLDLTSYADNPKYWGVHFFGQDKFQVIILAKTSKGDLVCCGNKTTECTQRNNNKLQQDQDSVWSIGLHDRPGDLRWGGIQGVLASYFDEADLQKQRAANQKVL